MPTAVIYARISKDDRGDHLGVDRQERACRELAARRGLEVLDVLVDNDLSASNGKRRPAFERLVDILDNRVASAVLTYHCDRLYRRGADLERLVKMVESSGAQVHTVAAGDVDLSTASGRMVARMLGAASQHEVERLGERMKMKSDELAAKGRAPGGRPPFGYSWEWTREPTGEMRRRYAINPDEAAALKMMARRVLEGSSLLALARELDAAGIRTREGRPWHHSTVRASLVNPAVAGLRVHRREIAGPGEWTPILDRATWEEIRAVLADPARKRTRPARRYLLSGLVVNPNGEPLAGGPSKGAAGAAGRRSYATRWPASPSLSIGADDLEELIVEAVLQRLDDAVLPEPETPAPGAGGVVVALEAELAELAELRGAGAISLSEWMAARGPLQERLTAARATAGSTRRPKRSELFTTPGAARRAWPALDLAARREIITAVVETVTVMPATRGRWTPLEERVDVTWRV